jgi:hypothetical protein
MSEPRVLLLHGNGGKWSSKDRPQQAIWENSCEAWIFAFGGDFINNASAKLSDIQGYDIIIANTDPLAMKNLLRLSLSRPAQTKWVTLLEGDSLNYLRPQPYIRDLLDNSDLVNCINKYTLQFFRKLTHAKVEYIGFPYPAEGIRSFSTPFHKRRKDIFLAPMLLGRWLEYFPLKDIGAPLYGYEKKLSKTLKKFSKNFFKYRSFDREYFHKKVHAFYGDQSLEIRRETVLPEFFRHNGGAYMWFDLDPRYTWGRYVLDAAALQMPIIATRSTGHAETFFPKTMVETEWDLEKAIGFANRLLSDKEFYEEVATVPLEFFDEFRPEVKKKEMLNALFV